MPDEFGITDSALSCTMEVEGHMLAVNIYSGEDHLWLLEVVDEYGNSTCWEDPFETDALALEEVNKTIAEEGVQVLIGEPRPPKATH